MSRHNAETVLKVRDVKKKIKNKWIIQGVSFDIYAGEVFGFLGPNGSGKTTTIRMLVDLIRPTEGTIEVCGKNVQKEHDAALRQIGSIVENPELYPYMTGWENLEHFAGMLPGVSYERIREVVDIVGMGARMHDKVRTYSLGMRQRLGIAQALLGNPRLLILDEPTNGLDPQGIKELRAFIRQLAESGLSIFISSHLLSEVQMMCDRVAIIRRGAVIAEGSVSELLQEAMNRVQWRLHPRAKAVELLAGMEGITLLEDSPGMESLASDGAWSYVWTQMEPELVPHAVAELIHGGISIYGVEAKPPSLEALFLTLTEGESIE
ncbi:ABC transporter ATP-binding protein [Xylanibacillus composti]|uniref:Bacitracin ABC transporter ATP-binding protein n=1 Tax=Xylanibacillus composti TaxID=1572762 RepID=A0A8J4M0M0_9BACL|nr:ABC transporter ATP-binding protein [Xylanibacillus composti]MDT9725530.1 ABC transporter ATP-binding protein [Xylanibacillus composti]GIQ67624.1 bacitracin ABC transporter ATP-binding protein [Xylanibacillus composti]